MDDLLLPLFPLNVVLLPDELLPLHIFEERYKQMIGECLQAKSAASGRDEFGVIQLKGEELQTHGCTARIVNVTRKYPDGRMDLLTVGSRRFEILYTNQEKAYLRGAVHFFDDEPGCDTPSDAEAERAIGLFRDALQRLRKSPEIPIHIPPPYRHLSFRIAGSLPLDLDFKQEILALRQEGERLARVTRLIEKLVAHVALVEGVRRKAGNNGDARPEQ